MIGCLHIRWYENGNLSEMITVSTFRLAVGLPSTTMKMETGSCSVSSALFTDIQGFISHKNGKFIIIILRNSQPSRN